MNYAIFKNGKRTVRQVFTSYEKARQHVRKLIRKAGASNYQTAASWEQEGMWDNISRNPTAYGILGYEIRKVATKVKLPVALY